MQITIITGGSRGDVQPYVALGKGLSQAGHSVRLVATRDFQRLSVACGLDFVAIAADSVEIIGQIQMRDIIERGNLLEILARTGRGAQQLARQMALSGLAACQGADLIIAGLGGLFIGLALALKCGVPLLQAHLMPFTPTRTFPSVLTPLPQTVFTRWGNRISHHLAQQMIWQMLRAADNQARMQVLQMQRASFLGPFDTLERQTQSILYGYSPQVIQSPDDWADWIHVTGYWFLEPPAEWEPPRELVHFLEAGSPPIYVGFGSMPSRKPEETVDLVLQALACTGQRAVLLSGWGGLWKEHLPKTVYLIDSIPHSWLFPRMAAVIHHGGAGTTAAGLAAGIPSIVTPFFGDQPFWGQRVYELGVGPLPIPRRLLTVERLAAAIQRAVSDVTMQRKAARLGESIRAEDGIAQAVALIEQRR